MKTDADYLEKLMTTYPSVPAEDWKKYLCIVQKAVFSEEEISQEEARFVIGCTGSTETGGFWESRITEKSPP